MVVVAFVACHTASNVFGLHMHTRTYHFIFSRLHGPKKIEASLQLAGNGPRVFSLRSMTVTSSRGCEFDLAFDVNSTLSSFGDGRVAGSLEMRIFRLCPSASKLRDVL